MEKTKTIKCKCGKKIEPKFNEKNNLFFYYCDDCKIGGKGKTEVEAEKEFSKKINEPASVPAIIPTPKNKNDLLKWSSDNMVALINNSAQFIDKPATKRMISKNINYAMSADLKKVWDSEKGRESVIDALSEAFQIGATLPEMGSIVPYGETCEFIPDVSAFEFALTTGTTAPFKKIMITGIYENDQYEINSKDGEFHFELKKIGLPRGEIIGVVVQAVETDTDKIIGEAYDTGRLMEKAARHSISYKYYLADMASLAKARSEEKDFILKWEKKVYEKDIQNPYVGADKPEMLRKLAGKSFFRKYMKTRNARAMKEEWGGEIPEDETEQAERTHKQTVNDVMDLSEKQFDGVIDAETVPEASSPKVKRPASQAGQGGQGKNLFNEGETI